MCEGGEKNIYNLVTKLLSQQQKSSHSVVFELKLISVVCRNLFSIKINMIKKHNIEISYRKRDRKKNVFFIFLFIVHLLLWKNELVVLIHLYVQ